MACIVQQLSTLRVRTLRYTIRKRKRLTSLMCLQGSTYYGSVFLSWALRVPLSLYHIRLSMGIVGRRQNRISSGWGQGGQVVLKVSVCVLDVRDVCACCGRGRSGGWCWLEELAQSTTSNTCIESVQCNCTRDYEIIILQYHIQ